MVIDPILLFVVGFEVGHWITVMLIWRMLSSTSQKKRRAS